jgi:uncharacterized protein
MNALVQTIIFILISIVLQGQDLAGQWHGALSVQGTQIRIVFHVNKLNNQYEATMDSPDQNVTGTKVTTTSFSYPNVKFEITGLGAIYEGVMTDSGITGKWVQSGTALFLVLLRSDDSPDKK